MSLCASWWLKTCREAAPRKEQYVFIGNICVYALECLAPCPPRLLFHALHYHTESDRRVWQQRSCCSVNMTISAPLYWLLSFLYSWEAKLHQYHMYPNKLDTHAFIWDRCWRCLVVLQAPDFVNRKLDGWRQDKRISGLLLRVRDEACLCQRTCPSSPGNWSAFVLELSSVQK